MPELLVCRYGIGRAEARGERVVDPAVHVHEVDTASAPASPPTLVPVTLTPEPDEKPAPAASETIEIEVGGDCRVRVGSSFDARALKRVLDVLSRAEGVGKKSR